MAKKALGRGLEALIRQIDEIDENGSNNLKNQIVEILIDNIQTNPYQPRKEFNEEEIVNLANSIKENGLLNPIIVKKVDDNNYILISGERRLRACKYLKYKKIKAIILDVSDEQLSLFALLENIQRVDLNDIEKAIAIEKMKKLFNFTDEQLAQKLGMSRSRITNYLRLLNLEDYIKEAISNNIITPGHARPLLTLDSEIRKEIYQKIIDEKLSVRDVEKIAKSIKNKKNSKSNNNNPEEEKIFVKLQEKFNKNLKDIRKANGKIKVTLLFDNQEELENFFNVNS